MKIVSDKVSGVKKGFTNLCYGFFSTLANPTRLAIIEKLEEGPMNVTGLVDALGQEQSMVSHNLRPLVRCKLVHMPREAGRTEAPGPPPPPPGPIRSPRR